MVPQEMPTLRPNQWLGGKVLDFVLLSHWVQIYREAPVLFVDLGTSQHFAGDADPDDDEIVSTRKRLLPPDVGAPGGKPVLVPILHMDHYFLALFDYTKETAHIIGRRINVKGLQHTGDVDWTEWNGHQLWGRIAQIMGWTACPVEDVQTFGVDWPQVGHTPCLLIILLTDFNAEWL
jgi:hypothetical protein